MDGAGRIRGGGSGRSRARCWASKSIVKHKAPYLLLLPVCSRTWLPAKSISDKSLILHVLMHNYSAQLHKVSPTQRAARLPSALTGNRAQTHHTRRPRRSVWWGDTTDSRVLGSAVTSPI
jgi:hypothetical protein